MKKLSIIAILILGLLTLNITAQTDSERTANGLTTEQKMLPFAMSMALSVLGEMHDDNNLEALKTFQTRIRYWSNELKPVVELDKNAPGYKRLDVAQTATKALRAKSSESDKWQMLVGERFGTIYAMLKKNRANGDEINADDLKFDIELIGILAGKAPANIPAKVNARFKEFSKLKDANNLTSEKNTEKLIREVVGILDLISPGKE